MVENGTVSARYLFGAPMGRAAVRWTLRQQSVWPDELEVPGTDDARCDVGACPARIGTRAECPSSRKCRTARPRIANAVHRGAA